MKPPNISIHIKICISLVVVLGILCIACSSPQKDSETNQPKHQKMPKTERVSNSYDAESGNSTQNLSNTQNGTHNADKIPELEEKKGIPWEYAYAYMAFGLLMSGADIANPDFQKELDALTQGLRETDIQGEFPIDAVETCINDFKSLREQQKTSEGFSSLDEKMKAFDLFQNHTSEQIQTTLADLAEGKWDAYPKEKKQLEYITQVFTNTRLSSQASSESSSESEGSEDSEGDPSE